jgi:hypothetical protein
MKARLGRIAERGLKKRQLALEAMNEVGLKKLEQPERDPKSALECELVERLAGILWRVRTGALL